MYNKKVLLIDDNIFNIKDVKYYKFIQTIHINPNKEPYNFSILDRIKYPKDYLYYAVDRGNKYAKYLLENKCFFEKMPTKGISDDIINKIIKWVYCDVNNKNRYIFMDWDETFTIIDGFYPYQFDSNNELNNLHDFFYDAIEFLCHEDTFHRKKSLIRIIQQKDIHFYFITRNPSANIKINADSYYTFINMLNILNIKPEQLLYCPEYKSKINIIKEKFPKLFI